MDLMVTCKTKISHAIFVLFAWLISRTFSANEQYFSLTTNQSKPTYPTLIPAEQGWFFATLTKSIIIFILYSLLL